MPEVSVCVLYLVAYIKGHSEDISGAQGRYETCVGVRGRFAVAAAAAAAVIVVVVIGTSTTKSIAQTDSKVKPPRLPVVIEDANYI